MSNYIASMISTLTGGAALGTGILPLLQLSKDYLGVDSIYDIYSGLILEVKNEQQSQFGSYPDTDDVAPSAVFTAIFAVLFLAHLFVFIVDRKRGHNFPLSLGFSGYCLIRLLGFALRIVWAKDILKLRTGMTSEVFLIISSVLLSTLNLVLAQRIYTWRHPVHGNAKLFWTIMYAVYAAVIAVIIMTIVAGLYPYIHLLSQSHYDMCRNVVKVSAVLICLYSLLAIALVLAGYLFPTSEADNRALICRPFWIQSYSPTYWPPKNAAVESEAFFKDEHPEDYTTVIRTMGRRQTEEPLPGEKPSENSISIAIIGLTSFFTFLGAIFRCVALFLNTSFETEGWICKPVVMYVMWGALETIINVIYLVGRIDLRFYRPDAIKNTGETPLEEPGEKLKDNSSGSIQPSSGSV